MKLEQLIEQLKREHLIDAAPFERPLRVAELIREHVAAEVKKALGEAKKIEAAPAAQKEPAEHAD